MNFLLFVAVASTFTSAYFILSKKWTFVIISIMVLFFSALGIALRILAEL